MIALPADQNRTHVKRVGNWRQEARILRSGFCPASSGFSKMDVASGLEKPLLAGYPSSLLSWKKKRKEKAWSQVTRHATKLIKKLYPRNVTLSKSARDQRKTFLEIHSFGNSLPRPQEPFDSQKRSVGQPYTKHKWLSCCHSYFSQCIYNFSGCCMLCFLSQLESLWLFLV